MSVCLISYQNFLWKSIFGRNALCVPVKNNVTLILLVVVKDDNRILRLDYLARLGLCEDDGGGGRTRRGRRRTREEESLRRFAGDAEGLIGRRCV